MPLKIEFVKNNISIEILTMTSKKIKFILSNVGNGEERTPKKLSAKDLAYKIGSLKNNREIKNMKVKPIATHPLKNEIKQFLSPSIINVEIKKTIKYGLVIDPTKIKKNRLDIKI